MAIKRTTQRQNIVRPSNIVPDSGGQAMAQASENIASSIANITRNIDQSQLDTALLEAETQGLHVGSILDKNNKPKPLDLLTLNSAFKPDMYNKANEAKAKARFRKFAINAFGLNVLNDVADYASDTFNKHGGKFADGKTVVETTLTKYANEWKDKVAPEVWNDIKPSINNEIGKYTRKASAIHLQNLRTKNLITANKQLIHLAKDRSDFMVNGTLNGWELETNDDLAERESKTFALIKANTTSDEDYQKIVSAYNKNLQSLVVEKSVTSAFIAKMPQSEIETMIKDIADNNTDPNIDSETIKVVGENKIKQLFGIEKQRKQEDDFKSLEIYGEVSNQIITSNLSDMPSINDIQSMNINIEHKNALIQIRQGQVSNLQSQKNKINTNTNLLLLESIKNGTPYQSELDTAIFMDRIKDGLVDVPELIKFRQIWSDRFFSKEADKMDTNFAPYFAELGSSSSYIHSPSYYLNNIPKLKELGVIGKALPNRPKPLMSVQQYVNKITEYGKRYEVESENRIRTTKIKKDHSKGLVGNQSTIKDLEKTNSVPKHVYVNNKKETLDILSDNADIVNASLISAVRFTTEYNTLHPSLHELFSQVGNIDDQNAFSKIVMAHSMLAESFRVNGKHNTKLGVVIEASGINDYLITNSRTFGMELTNKIAVAPPESKNRIVSKYQENNETEYEIFEKTFKQFTDTDLISDILEKSLSSGGSPLIALATGVVFGDQTKSKDMKKMIADFQSENGMDNLKEVILDDPRMMTLMNDMFWAIASSGDIAKPDAQGMQYAMGKVLQKLFNQIGIHQDMNGKKRWSFHPPLTQFLSTMPTTENEYGVTETLPIAQDIKHKDLYDYIHYSINGQPNLWNRNDGFMEAHNNKQYEIVPNDNFGATPSYSIYLVNDYGGTQLVNNNFRFDWATSPQNDSYKAAIKTIEDNDFRKFVYGLPGMQSSQIRNLYNRWNRGMKSDSLIKELENIYNRAQSILPLDKQKPINLTKYEAAEKMKFIETLFLDFPLYLEK